MALELARAYVAIVPSMQGVQSEINKAFGSGSGVDKQAAAAGKRSGGLLSAGLVGGLAGGVAGVAAGVLSTVGGSIAAFVGQAAAASDATNKFKQTLQFAGIDTKTIDSLTKQTQAYANATVYDLATVQNTTAQLAANGVKNYAGLTEAAGNLNAVAGGNADTFRSVALVLTQTAGAGKLTTENYNQLAEAIPGASGILQQSLKDAGAYTGNFRDAMAAGQITADEFNAAILKVGSQPVAVEAAKSTTTFEGALGNLQATIVGGLTAALNSIKPAATGAITAVSNGLGGAFTSIGTVITAIGPPIRAVFGSIASTVRPLLPLIGGVAAGITTFLVQSNFPAIIARLATSFGPLANLLPQIAGAFRFLTGPVGILITLFTAVYASNETFRTAINGLVGTLLGLASNLLGQLMPAITTLVTTLAGALGPVLASVVPVVAQLATMLANTLGQALQVLTPIIGLVASVLTAVVGAAAPLIAVVVKLAGQVLAALLPAFMQLAQQVLPPVMGILKALIPVIMPVIKILGTTLAGVIRALLPVVTAVFGAIVPVIKAALQVVTGVLNVVVGLLTGNFKQAWQGLGQIVSGAINLVVGVLRGAIGIVGAALGAIVNGGIAILKGAVSTVLTVGGQIVAGLANGIRNNAKAVLGAIGSVVNGAIDWAKSLLGIRSPSRVFAQIGRFTGQGLVKGLAGSQDQVKTAATSLVNQVTDAFTKLAAQREAAQKKLTKLDNQLAGTDTSTKSGKASAGKLRDQIREQQSILADIKAAPKGAKKSALLAALKDDTTQLTALAGRRDQLAGQLKTAQSKLADAITVRDDFAAQVQATTIGLGNVTDAYASVVEARKAAAASIADLQGKLGDLVDSQAGASSDADATRAKLAAVDQQMAALSAYGTDYSSKLTDLQSTRIDLASTLAQQMAKVADYAAQTVATQATLTKAQADSAQSAAPAILSNLRDAITQTRTFQTLLGQLKSFGVDDTTYSQILAKGVAGGGIGAAQELVQGGPALVQEVAGLQGQLATAGQTLGVQTSTVLYQAGVAAAQGSVDGIKAKIIDNQAAIALLQTAMAQSISALGINTAPLMKNAGAQVVAGLTDGIKGKGSDLDQVIGDLGKRAVTKLKKVLGIKSPSRVVRQEVGQQVGAGFVLGIEDMHAAAEQAAAGLASVPGAALGGVGFGDLGTAPAPITQVFTGPMGYTRDEVADGIATKARRAMAGVNIPKVSVR